MASREPEAALRVRASVVFTLYELLVHVPPLLTSEPGCASSSAALRESGVARGSRRGKKGEEDSASARFVDLYSDHLRNILGWLQQQPNFSTLQVQYQDVIDNPGRTASSISTFLDIELGIAAMTRVPDPRLHHQRVSVSS